MVMFDQSAALFALWIVVSMVGGVLALGIIVACLAIFGCEIDDDR